MHVNIKGVARIDKKTKNLVKRLRPGDIAIIDHKELDQVCAQALADRKVKAVLNISASLSLRYPNLGPMTLIEAGIYVLDEIGPDILKYINEGDVIEIKDHTVVVNGKEIGKGNLLNQQMAEFKMNEARKNLGSILEEFANNTIEYARQEQSFLLGEVEVPETRVNFKNRHSLIVVRGQNYKDDLIAIKSYIEDVRPVLIGVDGGADALLEFGFRPDVIIGDMDSISDNTLKSGAEIIVHAYSDGRAPGLERIKALGLKAAIFPAPGTSEDIAMLLAFHRGTELIVALGTHSNMIDFLDKGRKGMSSTFLVRLKVGSILVDAKGVNKLYKRNVKFRYLAEVVAAASVTVAIAAYQIPVTRQLLKVIWLKLKVITGI